MQITVLLVLLTVALICQSAGRINAAVMDEIIRVAVLKSDSEVALSGEGILVTSELEMPVVASFPAKISLAGGALQMDGKRYRRLKFSAPSAVLINNKPYRGLAELSVADNKILVVNQLPLEDYLVGLINCEISSAWPIEAVKAQAVIARTYALHRKIQRMNAPYHLESSVMDQVYEGSFIEDKRASRAVLETAGEVLAFSGGVIQAFYHSSCGGRTEASKNIWGGSQAYLNGVECQYCLLSPTAAAWEYKLPLSDIESRLQASGHKISGLYDVTPGELNSRGRLKRVVLKGLKGSMSVTGEQFRKSIGYGLIKSTRFTTKNQKNEIVFSGTGNGHGVGLCQWGSKHRALDGFQYGEILSYYYPGTELRKLSEIR